MSRRSRPRWPRRPQSSRIRPRQTSPPRRPRSAARSPATAAGQSRNGALSTRRQRTTPTPRLAARASRRFPARSVLALAPSPWPSPDCSCSPAIRSRPTPPTRPAPATPRSTRLPPTTRPPRSRPATSPSRASTRPAPTNSPSCFSSRSSLARRSCSPTTPGQAPRSRPTRAPARLPSQTPSMPARSSITTAPLHGPRAKSGSGAPTRAARLPPEFLT